MPRSSEGIISFLMLVGKLKNIPRTGWVLRDVKNPETIAGHMYRMGVMAMMLPETSGLDKNKCLKLALIHDIGECIVGDITPHCGVSVEDKHRMEEEAIQRLAVLAGETGSHFSTIYHEYAAQETSEAKFVKELDLLDMVLQAYEYEVEENSPKRLQEFFDSTKEKFHHPWTLEILKELHRLRNEEKK